MLTVDEMLEIFQGFWDALIAGAHPEILSDAIIIIYYYIILYE